MINSGYVKNIINDKAIVEFKRESACGGNCSSCSGCDKRVIECTVINHIGAKCGDRVLVETKSNQILFSAFIVYILPIFIFLISYFVLAEFYIMKKAILLSLISLFLSFFIVKIVDKKMKFSTKIIEIINENEENFNE